MCGFLLWDYVDDNAENGGGRGAGKEKIIPFNLLCSEDSAGNRPSGKSFSKA